MNSINIVQTTPIPTAVIRARVSSQELARFIPAACGKVWQFIRAAKLPGPGHHVAVYLGDGSVEVGAEVQEPFTGNERVVCSRLPRGRAVSVTHFGPYADLAKAHLALREWAKRMNIGLSAVCWEVYGHWEEEWNRDPSKIRTDVYCLISSEYLTG